ncbi:unnamed protein product [Amaranthus hypochondriacus]
MSSNNHIVEEKIERVTKCIIMGVPMQISTGVMKKRQRQEVESNSHVLFTCSFSWGIWMQILECWGLSGVLHNDCTTFFIQWNGLMKRRKGKDLWKLIFWLCYMVHLV